jgi:hypothetical protein
VLADPGGCRAVSTGPVEVPVAVWVEWRPLPGIDNFLWLLDSPCLLTRAKSRPGDLVVVTDAGGDERGRLRGCRSLRVRFFEPRRGLRVVEAEVDRSRLLVTSIELQAAAAALVMLDLMDADGAEEILVEHRRLSSR